jgi:hypothetical protein
VNRYRFPILFFHPGRFGKSLLVSTLRELFTGHKDLFEGLWIYDKIEWKEFPVICIDFSGLDYREQSLSEALHIKIKEIAKSYHVELEKETLKDSLAELIQKLSQKEKVVILIDEYDKPIIDYLDNLDQAEENRDILNYFYSATKSVDKFIQFLFITGVSKCSKISIFSDLNHLEDITIHDSYSTLTGVSEDELKLYFSEYIALLEKKYENYFPDIYDKIKDEYLGYSWDGKNFVYNPSVSKTLSYNPDLGL